MQNLKIINQADVRNIVVNELRKKDKLISKEEIRILIKNEVIKQNKDLYFQIDKLRKRINETERRLNK